MIGLQIQHYRIVRQLGAGGMGVVYEAEDLRLGRHVALKFLPDVLAVSPEVIERFEREARIASSLNHPNICTIYDIGVHEQRRFIVMELLDGESLRSRIHGHSLPLDLILDAGCQMADALDAAHASGIVHRDLKPANIFLTKRGQAKLLDFGVAKLGSERHPHDAIAETRMGSDVLTTPGMAVGSINYMSPEQARGEELDGRTDLFSLGLVLYEMATGRQAFAGQTTALVFDAILNRQPADPKLMNPELPDELPRVIMRSLEKDRRMRFQTAADMLAELGRIRRDTTGRAPAAATSAASAVSSPPSPVGSKRRETGLEPPAGRRQSRPRWLVAAVAGAIALAAYFAWNATKTPAFTERDMVLVADFTNSTGDPVFQDALKQAVSVQLQQTPYVTLLPDQRVARTLRLMQRPPDEPVIGQVARDLCQRAGAKATVEGSIAQLGTSYVMTLGVHNCQTGESLARQQAQATTKEDVLRQLGQAVTLLRQNLGESLASIQKYDVPVTDATTASLEALRAYGLAIKTRTTRGDEASIPFFRKATEVDPDFALAHAKLGVVYSNVGRLEDSRTHATRAYGLKDRVSEYERLYITWNYATKVLEDPKLTLETLELMTASYPRDFAARNNLGVYHMFRGEFEEALKQYQAAIAIAPDEPLPLANSAYALSFLGRREEAYQMAERSLAIRRDGGLALFRWMSAVVANDPKAPDFEKAATAIATPEQMEGARSALALWNGQLNEYFRLQDELRGRARAAHNDEMLAGIDAAVRITRAVFLRGRYLDDLSASLGSIKDPAILAQTAAVVASLGGVGQARTALPTLEPQGKKMQSVWLPTVVVRSYVRAAAGEAPAAIADLEAALREVPRAIDLNFHIGRVREQSGDLDGAKSNYEIVVAALPQLGFNPLVSGARMMLGHLLVKRGDTAGARAQFDALLEQWKNADTEFELLKQVREARKKL